MNLIEALPPQLTQDARMNFGTDFTGYIPAGQDNILYRSNGIPIKEVKIGDKRPYMLSPGEAALSGKFFKCSAVIAAKNDLLYVMHVYPVMHDHRSSKKSTKEFFQQIKYEGSIYSPNNLFERGVIIGRNADMLQAELATAGFPRVFATPPQIIQVPSEADHETELPFYILVYNNPARPGDIASFDLWFKNG